MGIQEKLIKVLRDEAVYIDSMSGEATMGDLASCLSRIAAGIEEEIIKTSLLPVAKSHKDCEFFTAPYDGELVYCIHKANKDTEHEGNCGIIYCPLKETEKETITWAS